MQTTLQLRFLGGFSLRINDRPISTIDWPRLQALLAYLVLHSTSPQSRTHLAFLFWPDSTEEQAHANLRHLVHRLRHALLNANSYICASRQTLHWQPPGIWTLDALDFECAIERANQTEKVGDQQAMRTALEEAVKLYHGDLLPGLYEEWLILERERLRQQFLHALERLLLALEQENLYQEALHVAQRLLQTDPLHEATYRHLMRLYTRDDDRAGALRTYHRCVTVLQRELGAEPSPPTQEAYQRLLEKEAAFTPSVSSTTTMIGIAPLVGRQSEWVQLQDLWHHALAGHAHMVILSGEAGIGKTRLAEELLAWLDRLDTITASAYCYPTGGKLAYTPLATWLRTAGIRPTLTALSETWLSEVARFVPDVLLERPALSRPGPLLESWQRQRLFEALAQAILSVHRPLLLLLEDLQWCDRDTLEWLHYLLHHNPSAQVLVLGTLRPEEVEATHPLELLLQSLSERKQVTNILLGPLDAIETAALATYINGKDLDHQRVIDLYRDTDGNPLFIVEFMRMNGGPSKGNPLRRPGDLSDVPPTIQAVIAARLEHLSPFSHEVMNIAAVFGRAFTFHILKQVSSFDEDTLVQGLDDLWQRRIIREQDLDAYDFSHATLRTVAYASLSIVRRRLIHQRVAEALEVIYADRLDAVSSFIAYHYERAGIIEQAIIYYQRAAEIARLVYANEEAILSYQQTLALRKSVSPSPQEPRRETTLHIYENLGDIFTLLARFDEARQAYQEAFMQVLVRDRMQQARFYRRIALTWKTQRNFEEALRIYSRAEAILEETLEGHTVAWRQTWIDIQSDCIEIYYWLAQIQEMAELIERTRPTLESDGTQIQRASFFQSLFMMNMRRERYLVSQETVEYARLSLAARLKMENEAAIAWACFNLGFAYLWYGDLDRATEHLQTTQTMNERIGDRTLQSRNLTYLTVLSRKRGWVDETRHFALQALAAATELQFPEYIAMGKANLSWVAWREGNLFAAQAEGLAALNLWRSSQATYMFRWAGLWPLIAIALTQDRTSEAVDYACLLLDHEQAALPPRLHTHVKEAIELWNAGQHETGRTYLQQATLIAQEMGYL